MKAVIETLPSFLIENVSTLLPVKRQRLDPRKFLHGCAFFYPTEASKFRHRGQSLIRYLPS